MQQRLKKVVEGGMLVFVFAGAFALMMVLGMTEWSTEALRLELTEGCQAGYVMSFENVIRCNCNYSLFDGLLLLGYFITLLIVDRIID